MTQKKAVASAEKRAKAANTENSDKIRGIRPYQFKPGQSGNPGGRPKRDFAAEIAQAILKAATDPKQFESIKRGMLKKFRKGDAKAFETLAARAAGRPHQQIDVTGQMNVSVVIDL